MILHQVSLQHRLMRLTEQKERHERASCSIGSYYYAGLASFGLPIKAKPQKSILFTFHSPILFDRHTLIPSTTTQKQYI
jgi:hypothetical protein